jgi:hypothetical protein
MNDLDTMDGVGSGYETLNQRMERRQLFLNLGIDENTQNCLARGGIFSYEDLLRELPNLRKFRHIGKVRLARIMVAVRAMGYEIPEGADKPWTPTERNIAEGKERLARRERAHQLRLYGYVKRDGE